MSSFTDIFRNFPEHMFGGTPMTKDVFRTLSKIFDEHFCKKYSFAKSSIMDN